MEIFIQHKGEQTGPHSYGFVKERVKTGAFSLNDLAWMTGLDSWKPLWELLGIAPPPPECGSQSGEKKLFRRTLTRSSAILHFLDRSLTTKSILGMAALFLIASWIYPPWVHYGRYRGDWPKVSHGWFFLFDTRQGETENVSWIVMRIDLGRLVLIDGIIAAVGWLFVTYRRGAIRTVIWSVLAMCLIGVVRFSATVIGNLREQREVSEEQKGTGAKENGHVVYDTPDVGVVPGQAKQFDPDAYLKSKGLAGTPAPHETLQKLFEEALGGNGGKANALLDEIGHARNAGYSDAEIYTYITQRVDFSALGTAGSTLRGIENELASEIDPEDLKKITLFDVDGEIFNPGSDSREDEIEGFHGRIRNEGTRTVGRITLKAFVYDAQGNLIEVKTFGLKDITVPPGEPASFIDEDVQQGNPPFLPIEHLPEGYKYRVEIAGAHYVQ